MATNRDRTGREVFEGIDDLIGTALPPACKWVNIGDSFTIEAEDILRRQARTVPEDGSAGVLRFWPSGEPLMILVVIGPEVTTGELRTLYIQGKEMTTAFRAALRDFNARTGTRGLGKGDHITVTYTADKPVEVRSPEAESYNAAKAYTVEVD